MLRLMLLLIACLLVGIIAYALNQSRTQINQVEKTLRKLNIYEPVRNGLDARYRDSDNDLVADSPVATDELLNPDQLVFSYISTDNPQKYEAIFRDLCDHLSQSLNRPVRYLGFTSRDEQLRAIRDGKVHIAGLNTGTVPLAVNACGFVPRVMLGGDMANTRYAMVIIVPTESPVQSVDDLNGHTITFTQPSSNSGFKAPYVILRNDFGLIPERDYSIDFSFSHEQSIQGIANRNYQIATVASDMLERAIGANRVNARDIRIIYESESFPTACIGHVHHLHPDLVVKLQEALISFRFDGTSLQDEFAPAGINGFQAVDYKNDYALIRRIDDSIGRKHILD